MNNFSIKLDEARTKLPLRRLMEQRGRAPANGNWESFSECPYCHHPGSAGVFIGDRGMELFKCHHQPCPTKNMAFDEVGVLQHELGLSDRKEACIALMKLAGVWQGQDDHASAVPSSPVSNNGNGHPSSPAALRVTSSVPLSSEDSCQKAEVCSQQSAISGGDPLAPPATDEGTGNVPPSLVALRWFYERLTLEEKDRKELWERRGLTELTIDALGYRSNPQSNKEILLEMEKPFPPAVLLDCGLWKLDEAKVSEPAKPNAQYYGMSIVERRDPKTGKKVRDDEGEPIRDCVWNNPILIPYFNAKGELVHLRPHKGMMKDRAPQFYVARPGKAHLEVCKVTLGPKQFAAVSEGEFKSAGQWQVFGDIAACGSLPGITMAKPLFGDIEEWVESAGVRSVVIGYDNEEKGDTKLPGYQEDEWKRYEAQAWARHLARQLSKQGYDGKVAMLPDEWRDPKTGKADWDGRLAALAQAETLKAENLKPEEVWERIKGRARPEFLAVIKKAMPVAELWQAGFFDRKEERIIKNRLEKIAYEPCLPIGGDDELAVARRLQRLGMRLKRSEWFPLPLSGFLFSLAAAYTAVNGRYFKTKPLTEKQLASWERCRELARSRGDEDAKRACEIVLRGKKSLGKPGNIPQAVSDFYLKPQYVLHRINGTRTRMVTLHNVHGVNTALLTLPSREYTTPVEFRKWLADNATGGAWDGGQNELTALHEDLGHELAFKDVMEVPLRGYHDKSRMWFF
jgi:hypothetical protein